MSKLREFYFDCKTLAYIGESPPDDAPEDLIAVRDFSEAEARRRVADWERHRPLDFDIKEKA